MDELAARVESRMTFEASGVAATVQPGGSLTVSVANAATVPVTGLCTPGAESYGGQTISYLALAAGQSVTLSLTGCNPGFGGSGGATGSGGSGAGVAGTGGSGATMGGAGATGGGAGGAAGAGLMGGTGAGLTTGMGTSGQGGATGADAGGAAADGGPGGGGHLPSIDGGRSGPFLGTDLDQGPAAASSSAGCNCALDEGATPGTGLLVVGLFGLLLAGRRRRLGARSPNPPPARFSAPPPGVSGCNEEPQAIDSFLRGRGTSISK